MCCLLDQVIDSNHNNNPSLRPRVHGDLTCPFPSTYSFVQTTYRHCIRSARSPLQISCSSFPKPANQDGYSFSAPITIDLLWRLYLHNLSNLESLDPVTNQLVSTLQPLSLPFSNPTPGILPCQLKVFLYVFSIATEWVDQVDGSNAVHTVTGGHSTRLRFPIFRPKLELL